jgi:iron complex transport system ATP-binding protein
VSDALLAVAGLALHAAGRTLVEGLDLQVRVRERWAVLGPNGAGKSTLLAVLSGARPADAGQVVAGGRPIGEQREDELARLRALVSDRWVDPFKSSVVETVMTARYAFGSNDDSDRLLALELLVALDCGDLALRDVRQLSRGERQRVAVATGFAQTTPVVLLDEPTAHQDPRHQAWVVEYLRSQPERALVATLHDVNAAVRFATHALLLSGRGSYRIGPASEVLHAELLSELYRTPITALEADGERFFHVHTAR